MNQQNSEQQTSNLLAKANVFDGISALCLLGGVVASGVTQSALASMLPFAGAVGVHIFNRRQLMTSVSEHYEKMLLEQGSRYEMMIRDQNLHIVNHQNSLKELNQKAEKLQSDFNGQLGQYRLENLQNIESKSRQIDEINLNLVELKEVDKIAAEKYQQLADKVQQLQKIENVSYALQTHPSSANMYYERAVSHQNLGDHEAALSDYTQAIECDPQWATAYHSRGMLYAEIGNRKAAVEDLRQAAKYYFDKGDIENYQVARELFKEYYSLDFIDSNMVVNNEVENGNYQPVLTSNLFGDN